MAICTELAPYSIQYQRKAQKAILALSVENMERVLLALEVLANTTLGDIKFLGDADVGAYHLRVGDLRVFFDVLLPERIIQVTDIEKRGEAYAKKSKRKS